jgi:lipoprotein-releasing system ATP-binding protein
MSFHDGEEDIRIFDDLSFSINSGSSVAIVGESGVGKTTLLYILGGLEQPSSGEVLFSGDEEVSLSKLWRQGDQLSSFRGDKIGFVFQFHNLLPEFSALENVAIPLRVARVSKDEAEERANYLLKRVGLSHRTSHRPGALSGGEQQRVAIARALSRSPKMVLADEPTGNLDQKNSSQVRELLLEVQKEQGLTLVVVTHSREFAGRMERILEITAGGIEEIRQ